MRLLGKVWSWRLSFCLFIKVLFGFYEQMFKYCYTISCIEVTLSILSINRCTTVPVFK